MEENSLASLYDSPVSPHISQTSQTEFVEFLSGFDLNNALKNYRSIDSATIKTLVNLPIAFGGGEIILLYIPCDSDNAYGIHILFHIATDISDAYIRSQRRGNVWSQWRKLTSSLV